MSYQPCLNPHCKSHGQPHPNCRCYGSFAEGGEVEDFCSTGAPHFKECEYFAEGGAIEAEPTWDDTQAIDPVVSEPTWEATEPLEAPEIEPTWDQTIDPTQYESPGQQMLTAMEGAAQGVAGPLAPLMEEGLSKLGVPGISPDEIAAREATNPIIHGGAKTAALIGSFATGVGEAGLAVKGAANVAKALNLGKMGSGIVAGALSSGLIQGGDELTKALLGQGDPNEGVAAHLVNVGGASLLGGFGAGLVSGVQAAKLGTKLTSFLGGVASAADSNTELKAIEALIKDGHVSQRAFDLGKKAFQYMTAPAVAGVAGGVKGYKDEGAWGALKGAVEGAIFGGALQHSMKTLAPALVKVMAAAPHTANLGSIARDVLDHTTGVSRGAAQMNSAVDALFKGGSQQAWNESRKMSSRRKLQDTIDKGGVTQSLIEQQQVHGDVPGMAEGGDVALPTGEVVPTPLESMNDGVAQVYPEQNILINAAKARVSDYLTSLKPQSDQPKLIFDDEPDTTEQKQSYDRATDIANNPLSILHEIQNGTVDDEHVRHFKALYPEIDEVLQRRLTDKITDLQMKGERPPLAVIQGLSMLMGVPLSSELAPDNIASIQAMYQQQAANKQTMGSAPAAAKTKDLSKLGQSMKTTNQSLVARSQRPK